MKESTMQAELGKLT